MIDFTAVSHFALAVPDIEEAMRGFEETLGLSFARLTEMSTIVEVDGEPVAIPLLVTYSVEGPPHLELIEGPAGTVWEPAAGIHHVGVWSEDLAGDVDELAAAGLAVELSGASRSGRTPHGFTYHRSPSGYRVELVDAASKPMFETWFAGGAFGAG